MNSKELLDLALKNGWEIKSQRGSHIKLINNESKKTTIVPYHGSREIPKGTLHAILKQLGIKE